MAKKDFSCQVKQIGPEEDRVLRFIATSEQEDRDGDIILTSAWSFDNYLKNPVFMALHDYRSLPVGRTIDIIPDYNKGQTYFDVKFPTIEELSTNPETPSDHALFADTIYQMYKHGYLSAVSVGFSGIDCEPRTAGNGQHGRLYKAVECLELSAVPIPANPGALIEARSKGIISNCQYQLLNKGNDFEIDIDSIEYVPTKKGNDQILEIEDLKITRGEFKAMLREAIEMPQDNDILEIEGLEISRGDLKALVQNAIETALDRR